MASINYTYNKATFETSESVSYTDVLSYISQLINKSHFNEAINYISQIKLPAITFADEFNLSIMEQFIRLLIYQGYHIKAESIIEKAKSRALDLYLAKENSEILNIYVKFNIWDSIVRQTLKREFPSVPIFESLDHYFELITDDLVKAHVYLQASHLFEFIGSQEHFLKEALRLVSNTPRSENQAYIEIQILNALGVFYGLIGDLQICKDIFEETISKAKTLGDKRRVAGSMINIANIYYLDNNQTPETQLIGKGMLQESLKLSEEIDCVEYATIANLLLAEYYFKRGKSSQSLPYYEKVYSLQTKRGIIANQEKIDDLLARTQNPTNNEKVSSQKLTNH
jgi:tetratricopeptide (TPR) repeat protein